MLLSPTNPAPTSRLHTRNLATSVRLRSNTVPFHQSTTAMAPPAVGRATSISSHHLQIGLLFPFRRPSQQHLRPRTQRVRVPRTAPCKTPRGLMQLLSRLHLILPRMIQAKVACTTFFRRGHRPASTSRDQLVTAPPPAALSRLTNPPRRPACPRSHSKTITTARLSSTVPRPLWVVPEQRTPPHATTARMTKRGR